VTYLEQIEAAVRAVEITSDWSFTWLGRPSLRLPRSVTSALTPQTARELLRSGMQTRLYDDFYLRGGIAEPIVAPMRRSGGFGTADFVDRLSAANRGTGSFQNGWTVVGPGDEGMVVERDGLALRVQPSDCRALDGNGIEPGADVLLRLPKELPAMSPGFYVAVGDAGMPSGRVTRMYWHLTAPAAFDFISEITSRLNAARLQFTVKVVDDPDGFRRCDAGVLYLRKEDYRHVVDTLVGVYEELQPLLDRDVPALTKPLAPGLAVAEDPGEGESYGFHRCSLLADGLLAAFDAGESALEARVEAVLDTLSRARVDITRPYLSPESSDIYAFRAAPARLPRPAREARRTGGTPDSVEIAARIGRRLAREAVWHEGRCNWIGERIAVVNGTPSVGTGSLSADLYGGTAGISLFLVGLAGATGDQEVRRTALGAIRQALRTAESGSIGSGGLYLGADGVAVAAMRVAATLDDEETAASARRLVAHRLVPAAEEEVFDLLAGTAGSILAALQLEALDSRMATFAIARGDALLESSRVSKAGRSWPPAEGARAADLTGLSHGAAGAALALLELYAATGETRFRAAAEEAFAYERYWFDDEAENWPDLREQPRSTRPREGRLRCLAFWCHGAAGIAISRVRAFEVLRDPRYLTEAETALRTTAAAVDAGLAGAAGDFSLCHGLAGNADILHWATSRLTVSDADRLTALPAAVGAAGSEHYGNGGPDWPCGLGGGVSPGLMVGLAGIGHFYLRLHDPTIPPVVVFSGS
jgi:Lanthionine synthetase C-like protein/HopA1 effector protein family